MFFGLCKQLRAVNSSDSSTSSSPASQQQCGYSLPGFSLRRCTFHTALIQTESLLYSPFQSHAIFTSQIRTAKGCIRLPENSSHLRFPRKGLNASEPVWLNGSNLRPHRAFLQQRRHQNHRHTAVRGQPAELHPKWTAAAAGCCTGPR